MAGARSLVAELESIRGTFGPEVAGRKAALLGEIARAAFPRRGAAGGKLLSRVHETLLFLRAYPDDARVHAAACAGLAGFSRLLTRDFARRLEDTGVMGTRIDYPFDFPVARWIARRYPADVEIDWKAYDHEDRLQALIPHLAGPAEDLGIDDEDISTRAWMEKARGKGTDFAWLVRRLEALSLPARLRDHLFDALEIPIRWRITDFAASRTGAALAGAPVFFHDEPLQRKAPEISSFVRRPPPRPPARLAGREAARLVDLAQAALATREREMYPISHANPADVSVYTLERGVQVALLGTRPERRMLLEGLWGYLLLKNGLPVGYGCASALFGSAELAANVFETYRQGESALLFAQLLRVFRAHTGAETFTALPYQFGGDNEEALKSGAFWFYHKLGYRPFGEEVLKKIEDERKKIEKRRGYRSSPKILRGLTTENLYLSLGGENRNVLGNLPLPRLGFAITEAIARRYGADREGAVRAARKFVAEALSFAPRRNEVADEFCLFLSLFEDIPAWTRPEKRALAQILEAKTDDSERDYVLRMNGHARLKKSVLGLLMAPTDSRPRDRENRSASRSASRGEGRGGERSRPGVHPRRGEAVPPRR